MTVEDRLHALVAQARQQHGDVFLRAPGQLVPRLIGQAPDLHAEIKALAAVLEGDSAARIAAAADGAGETARIAAEIAAKERLSIGPVQTALAVASRLGPLGGAAAAPAAGGWAGDSVAVGGQAVPPAYPAPYPPHQPPPYQPHVPADQQADEATPIWKNKWAIGAVAAAGLFFFYQSQNAGPTAPQPQPPPPPPDVVDRTPKPDDIDRTVTPERGPTPPPPPPNTQSGIPTLQLPGGAMPTLTAQAGQNGAIGMAFQVQTQGGLTPGFVMLPPGGWDMGPGTFAFLRPGNTNGNQPDTMGQSLFQRVDGQSRPVRVAQPQWQQDNAGVGAICVAFMGQSGGGADVALNGADMCVMDASCRQPIGCGRVQFQGGPQGGPGGR